jgi:hypothetical protein
VVIGVISLHLPASNEVDMTTTNATEDNNAASKSLGRESQCVTENNGIGTMDWTPAMAPIHASNTLWQLEALLWKHRQQLKSLTQQQEIASSTNKMLVDQHLIDELLMTTEFLYGSKLMTSALTLVDSCRSLITVVVAPSGRVAYLVRGSRGDETYLCLLSTSSSSSSSSSSTTTTTPTLSYAGSVHYCSCRSYLESTTNNAKTSGVSPTQHRHQQGTPKRNNNAFTVAGPPICKHLLALKLLPYLEGPTDHRNTTTHDNKNHVSSTGNGTKPWCCPVQKPVTEEEFATLLLNHVSFYGREMV